MKKVVNPKRKITTIYLIYIILNVFLFITASLQKIFILECNMSLIPFCVITAIIVYFIIAILCAIADKHILSLITGGLIFLSLVGVLLVVFFSILLESRIKMNDFLKNATQTTAVIGKIDREISFHKDSCGARSRSGRDCVSINGDKIPANDYYQVYFIYYVNYEVENKTYYSKYKEKEYRHFDKEETAMQYDSKYIEGDTITIYYNNNNPEKIMRYAKSGYVDVYITMLIILIFNIYYFYKYRQFLNEYDLK